MKLRRFFCQCSTRWTFFGRLTGLIITLILLAISHISPDYVAASSQTFSGLARPVAITRNVPIAFGQILSDSISSPTEQDIFTFSGAAGDVVRVRMAETSGNLNLGGFTMYRPDGTQLCSTIFNDNSCTLNVSGAHTIIVTGSGAGNYEIAIQRRNNPVGCTSLSFGASPITASISQPAEMDCYTFSGATNDMIRVRMAETSGNLNLGGFTMYRPDGTQLCSTIFNDNSCTFNASGTHSLIVTGSGAGNYEIAIQRRNNPVGCTPLSFGASPISASINRPTEMDCFTFTGSAGDVVRVRMAETSGNLNLGGFTMYRPDGTQLCSTIFNDNSCTLNASGTHSLIVTGTGAGTYEIALACISGTCPPPTVIPTPTNTPTPGPTVTPTPTPPPNASTPVIIEIRPNHGQVDLPNDVNIYGFNFDVGATARLNTTILPTIRITSMHLRATVPAGLSPGVYDLTVTNPNGRSATLPDAYTVFAVANEDLFGHSYELWTNPATLRAGGMAQIGLVVHRRGGKQPLSDVKVRFFLGNPDSGGVIIGDGVIPLLSPHSSASTSGVNWTPPAEGIYVLYALIDPDNVINETFENNNQVSRIVRAHSPNPDQIPPHVDSFTINHGAATTASRDVVLNTTASDNPGGSGVARLLYVEFEYSQGARQWVPVQNSGWLTYDLARNNYPWQLIPSAGVKYLQAWAADRAGNISPFPHKAFINFLPSNDEVARDQVRIYRRFVTAGQALTAHVTPISGDPDLYIWPPDHETRPAWVSNSSQGVDQVSFIAPVSGIYQIEVYGFTAATYQIDIEVGQASILPESITSVQPDKPERSTPVAPVASEPGTQIALPEVNDQAIYLPIVLRQ